MGVYKEKRSAESSPPLGGETIYKSEIEDTSTSTETDKSLLNYQRFKLKIIFAITLLVLAGSLVLVISLLSGGSTVNAFLILIGFSIFYAYETKKEFKSLTSNPPLDNSEIMEMVRRLAKQGNVSEPEVIVENEPVINAYALSTPKKSYIILPQGIIDSFNDGTISKEEMESILAHEMGHIINKDSFINTGLFSIIRLFQIIHKILERLKPLLFKITKKSSETTNRYRYENSGLILAAFTLFISILLIIVIISSLSLFILISICIMFLNFLRRQQEYVADLISAKLTGKPYIMAQALHTIHKLDLIGLPESLLSPHQSALLVEKTSNLKDKKLTFRERLDELKYTHPNLINRIKLILSPEESTPNQFTSVKEKINNLNLINIELKSLPVIRLGRLGIDISLSHPLYHGILLGFLGGMIYLIIGSSGLFPQVNYLLFIVGGAWIGLFSLSIPYSQESSFSSNSLDKMLTIAFIFMMTYSLLTTIAVGVLVFYSTLILGTLITFTVSILSAILATYIKKGSVFKACSYNCKI